MRATLAGRSSANYGRDTGTTGTTARRDHCQGGGDPCGGAATASCRPLWGKGASPSGTSSLGLRLLPTALPESLPPLAKKTRIPADRRRGLTEDGRPNGTTTGSRQPAERAGRRRPPFGVAPLGPPAAPPRMPRATVGDEVLPPRMPAGSLRGGSAQPLASSLRPQLGDDSAPLLRRLRHCAASSPWMITHFTTIELIFSNAS